MTDIIDGVRQVADNLLDRIRRIETRQPEARKIFEAYSTDTLTLSITGIVDVPGVELVLEPGAYLVTAITDVVSPDVNDDGATLLLYLRVNADNMPSPSTTRLASTVRPFLSNSWIVTLWDYRQYVLVEDTDFYLRMHETDTIGRAVDTGSGSTFWQYAGHPEPRQAPAIASTDLDHQLNYAVLFDGVDDNISSTAGSTGGSCFGAGRALEIWFKTSYTGGAQYLLGNAGVTLPTGINSRGACLYINAAGNIVGAVRTNAGASASVVSPLATYRDGLWHHVVLTWDATTMYLIVDGQQIASGADVIPSSGGFPTVIYVGNDPVGLYPFNGYLDEAAGYNTFQTLERVRTRYNAASGVVYYPSITYADEVAADAPVLNWRFNETRRSIGAIDKTLNALNGTYNTGTVLQQDGAILVDSNGFYDQAVRLDGVTGYATRADSPTLHPAVGSLECWMRNKTTVTQQYIAGNADIAAARYGFALYLNPSGNLVALLASAAASISVTSTQTYIDNRWHYVLMTWDATTLSLYIDGQLAGTTLLAGLVPAWNGYDFRVGASPNGTAYYFTGFIDELALYATALSAARAETHYRAGKSNRAWLTLGAIKAGGSGTSYINTAKMIATKIEPAARS